MFSLIGGSSSSTQPAAKPGSIKYPQPTLNVTVGRPSYHPGEQVIASVEISNQPDTRKLSRIFDRPVREAQRLQEEADIKEAVLIEEVLVEVKGIERVDPSWITTPRANSASELPRGERLFLDSQPITIAASVLIPLRGTKTWSVRATLPKVLPPSYRGTAVRYTFFLVVKVKYAPTAASNSTTTTEVQPLVSRVPFRVWTLPNLNGVVKADEQEDYGEGGIVPVTPVEVEVQFREKNPRSNWVAATEALSGGEEEEDPPQAVKLGSPFTTAKGQDGLDRGAYPPTLYSSLSVPSQQRAASVPTTPSTPLGPTRRYSLSAVPEGLPPPSPDAQALAVHVSRPNREDSDGEDADSRGTEGAASLGLVPENRSLLSRRDSDTLSSPPMSPTVVSIRGKSYNIRVGDQLLVRFAPRSPQPVYTLGDVVSGTLDFSSWHPGDRCCLKVSVLLESREVVASSVLHASRKLAVDGAVIPKVQCEYHEVAVNLLHTHFIFSIPTDAPQSFVTPVAAVEWVLRFEFTASPPGWRQGDPTANSGRVERAEWQMPITVHAPMPRAVPGPPKGGRKVLKVSSPRRLREGGYQRSPMATPTLGSPKSPRAGASRMSPFSDKSRAEDASKGS